MSPRSPNPFINREASWLEFNSRVLEEAQDPKNPLLERLRFYCIFYANLDEFFMVRVASILRRIGEGEVKPDPSGLTPFQELEMVNAKVRALESTAQALYETELLPALAKEKMRILDPGQLGQAHQRYLDATFEREIYPVLTPIAVDPEQSFPRLVALALHLAVLLEPGEGPGAQERRLALVQVPGRIAGLLRLPDSGGVEMCWLADVVRARVSALFSGYRVVEVAAFRLTRDSELELDEEGYRDYVRMLELELKKRAQARPIRLECEQGMSAELLGRIERGLGVSPVRAVSRAASAGPARPDGARRSARLRQVAVCAAAPADAGRLRAAAQHFRDHRRARRAAEPPVRFVRPRGGVHRGRRRGSRCPGHQADPLPDERQGVPPDEGAGERRRKRQAGHRAAGADRAVRRGSEHRLGARPGGRRRTRALRHHGSEGARENRAGGAPRARRDPPLSASGHRQLQRTHRAPLYGLRAAHRRGRFRPGCVGRLQHHHRVFRAARLQPAGYGARRHARPDSLAHQPRSRSRPFRSGVGHRGAR